MTTHKIHPSRCEKKTKAGPHVLLDAFWQRADPSVPGRPSLYESTGVQYRRVYTSMYGWAERRSQKTSKKIRDSKEANLHMSRPLQLVLPLSVLCSFAREERHVLAAVCWPQLSFGDDLSAAQLPKSDRGCS